MAVIHTVHPIDESIRTDISGLISAMSKTYLAWNEKRLVRKALARLSDHQLRDIGLSRNDVYSL